MSQNLRIFCPLLGTVHYWALLLHKNGWEAGFCPLLGAFPLLGSALLGEYSVCIIFEAIEANEESFAGVPRGFPVIKQNPKMKVVEKGRHAILVCEAEGDPPVNIYWVKDSIRLQRNDRFTVMQQGKLRGG